MVTKYGMSEEMGPVEYGENQEEVFLGRSVTQTQSVSEEVAQKIDKEIRKLVDEGYNKAKQILTDKIDDLHKIAKALITYETLTGEEIENIINKNVYPADKQNLKVDDVRMSVKRRVFRCLSSMVKKMSIVLLLFLLWTTVLLAIGSLFLALEYRFFATEKCSAGIGRITSGMLQNGMQLTSCSSYV
jgi:hypothetical protein